MKARRKSDGKIIEVETYMLNSKRGKDGSWESSYKDINSGLVYESSELFFNLDYYTVIQGWVVRDENGRIFLYEDKPERENGKPYGKPSEWISESLITELCVASFPDLAWKSEPQECEIIIKRKKNG